MSGDTFSNCIRWDPRRIGLSRHSQKPNESESKHTTLNKNTKMVTDNLPQCFLSNYRELFFVQVDAFIFKEITRCTALNSTIGHIVFPVSFLQSCLFYVQWLFPIGLMIDSCKPDWLGKSVRFRIEHGSYALTHVRRNVLFMHLPIQVRDHALTDLIWSVPITHTNCPQPVAQTRTDLARF